MASTQVDVFPTATQQTRRRQRRTQYLLGILVTSVFRWRDRRCRPDSGDVSPTLVSDPSTPSMTSTPQTEAAAACIQRCAKRFLANHMRLHRANLVARLQLEKTLSHGMRMAALCMGLFICMLVAVYFEQEKDTHLELGLLQNYRSMFGLEDLAEVRTIDDVYDWLKNVSVASREAQVTSSNYMVELAEQRILTGTYVFRQEETISAPGLGTEMMVHNFTFSVWVNPPGESPASPTDYTAIVRKPIGVAAPSLFTQTSLSCWSWSVSLKFGFNLIRFQYGAHDQADGKLEETVELGTLPDLWNTTYFLVLVVRGIQDTPYATVHQEATLYANGVEVSHVPLPRPVTDCQGDILYVGGSDMPMADLTFYPRALSAFEVVDALTYGIPLTALIRGKLPATRHPDDTASLLSSEDWVREVLSQGQTAILESNLREEMLTRISITATSARTGSNSTADVPVLEPRPRNPRFIDLGGYSAHSLGEDYVGQDTFFDPLLGKNFTDLFPGRLENFTDGGRFHVPDFPMHLFDIRHFGPNMTLSMWVQPDFGLMVESVFFFGYSLDYGTCWDFMWRSGFNSVTWRRNSFDPQDEINTMSWGDDGLVAGERILRQLVFVQERLPDPKVANAFRIRSSSYLDGVLVKQTIVDPLPFEDECGYLVFPGTLGDAMLGYSPNRGFKGDMQQVRLYYAALQDEEVRTLHSESVDPDSGAKLRQCLDESDQGFADAFGVVDSAGNDCAWYYEARQEYPDLCSPPEIKASCPIACGVRKACWYAKGVVTGPAQENSLLRMMTIDSGPGGVTVCSSEDAYGKYGEKCMDYSASYGYSSLRTCRYSDQHFRPRLADEINQTDEWTSSFWLKLPETDSVYPHTEIMLRNQERCSDTVFIVVNPADNQLDTLILVPGPKSNPNAREFINFSTKVLAGTFSPGRWNMLTVSVGPLIPPIDSTSLPQRFIWLSVNAMSVRLPTSEPALIRDGRFGYDVLPDFFGVHGSVVIGPFWFSARSMLPWALQSHFYSARSYIASRTGTRTTVNSMDSSKVEYNTRAFRTPAFLLAPPLLLQTRKLRTFSCPTSSGRQALRNIALYLQEQCSVSPYTCPVDSFSSLGGCTSDENQNEHFGRGTLDSNGEAIFGEFLLTATDSSYVARNGQAYDISELIDVQSRGVRLLLVLAAPDVHGRVSTVEVTFAIKSRVKADVSVDHFRAMEPGGSHIRDYTLAVVCLTVIAGLLLADAIMRMYMSLSRGKRVPRLAVFDFIFAIATTSVWWTQVALVHSSKDQLVDHLDRLMNEARWTSNGTLAEIFEGFIRDNDRLRNDIQWQTNGRLAAMVACFIALARVILATQTHPRIAIVVDTLYQGADALVHYFIVLALFFMSFSWLGLLFFGGSHEEFESVASVAELLLTLMSTGEFPEDSFEEDWAFIGYIVVNMIIFFFLMLNFVLAIVVNMYAKVQQALDDLEVEEFLVVDVTYTVTTLLWQWWYKWPQWAEIITALRQQAAMQCCTVESLAAVSPTWSRGSRVRFVQFYRRYSFLAPRGRAISNVERISREVELRIALLLGTTPASEYDHIMSRRREKAKTAPALLESFSHDSSLPAEPVRSRPPPREQAVAVSKGHFLEERGRQSSL